MHQSTQKTRIKKQERKPNTIFNEIRQFAYVLVVREILLIQQLFTACSLLTIHEGSAPLFIPRESQDFRKPQLDSTLFQNKVWIPTGEADSLVGRPFVSVDRSVDWVQQKVGHASRSTAPVRSPCYGRPSGQSVGHCSGLHLVGRSVGHCSGLHLDCLLALLNSNLCTIFRWVKKLLHQAFVSTLSLSLYTFIFPASCVIMDTNTDIVR